MRLLCLPIFSLLLLLSVSTSTAQTTTADLEPYLVEGRILEGIQEFQQREDANAQYAVGILKVLAAVEGLSQDLYRYGLKSQSPELPFVRLPIPANENPEELTYQKWRQVLQDFVDDLEAAEFALGEINSEDVKIKVPIGLVRLDLNDDGQAAEGEVFWKIFAEVSGARPNQNQQRFDIGFDKADVHWLIGYTHLLRAMAETWLAYDTEEFFLATAPTLFAGATTKDFPFDSGNDGPFDPDRIADVIAAIHLAKFEVVEPQRMQAALEHLEAMIVQSRRVWEYVEQETDDDREWIPGPQQTSLTPLSVEQEQVDGWHLFLSEAEAVLAGDKLVPHWRLPAGTGINLRKVFTEPREFDLVMWVHGLGAVPYLEEGDVVSQETARRLQQAFQGQFLAFATWFN